MRIILLIATLTLAQAQPGNGQAASFTCWIRGPADKLAERPSPLDSSAVQLGGGTIKLCYGRPSARGRKVMGELVPFDQPWRLGANEATSIHLPFAAEIAGARAEPGTYTPYVSPGASTAQIIVNRGGQVETLTLKFAPATGNATELVFEWEKTRIRIPIRRTAG